MSVGTASVSAQTNQLSKTVYYTGTDTLKTGYALCYDHDATAGKAKENRGQAVEKPSTNNLIYFAGFVAPESNGLKGPGFCRVLPNGFRSDYVDVYIEDDLSAAAINSPGSPLYTHNNTYAVNTTAAAGNQVALIAEPKNGTGGTTTKAWNI
jgi:hypothetical protein